MTPTCVNNEIMRLVCKDQQCSFIFDSIRHINSYTSFIFWQNLEVGHLLAFGWSLLFWLLMGCLGFDFARAFNSGLTLEDD